MHSVTAHSVPLSLPLSLLYTQREEVGGLRLRLGHLVSCPMTHPHGTGKPPANKTLRHRRRFALRRRSWPAPFCSPIEIKPPRPRASGRASRPSRGGDSLPRAVAIPAHRAERQPRAAAHAQPPAIAPVAPQGSGVAPV